MSQILYLGPSFYFMPKNFTDMLFKSYIFHFSFSYILFNHPDYICVVVLDCVHRQILLLSVTSHHKTTLS